MGNGNLEMSANDQKVTFNLFDTIKHPNDHKACFKMEAVEHEVAMVVQGMASQSLLEKALNNVVECLTKEIQRGHVISHVMLMCIYYLQNYLVHFTVTLKKK